MQSRFFRQQRNVKIFSNVSWFFVSLVLAFIIWFVAETENDPIEQRLLRNIPIQVDVSDDFIVTSRSRTAASIDIRAQQSILSLLTSDDIIVRADLTDFLEGTYTVPLETRIARSAIADTSPTQITVTLERIQSQQKPLRALITEQPPTGFSFQVQPLELSQAEVLGPASTLEEVVEVVAEIDLTNQRNPIQQDFRLVALNENGNRVAGVTIEPANIAIAVDIFQDDAIKQITVLPDINTDTLPEGYSLTSVNIEPQTIFVQGNPVTLRFIVDTFSTENIDLTGRTEDFEISVPIILPRSNLVVLDDQNTATVSVGITALTSVRQVDNIPIEFTGNDDAFFQATPETISVVLKGPITIIENILIDDIQAVINVSELELGNHQVEPSIILQNDQISVDSILPSVIDVLITPEEN